MNSKELAESAARGGEPPAGLNDTLKSLWLARAGRWQAAHDICENIEGDAGAWVHAHLHRVEGDLFNAGYWYDRAGRPTPEGQEKLGEEWCEMVDELSGS